MLKVRQGAKKDTRSFQESNPNIVPDLIEKKRPHQNSPNRTSTDLSVEISVKTRKNDLTSSAPLALPHEQPEVTSPTFITTPSKTAAEPKELHNFLYAEGRKKSLPNQEEYEAFYNTLNPIQKVRNRCDVDSNLYTALHQLYEKTIDLPFNIIESLGKEATLLLDHLEDKTISDKSQGIQSFVEKSYQLFHGEHYEIKGIIVAIAIAALVTAIAALIGFGVGFGVGLWTGPGAFFSALLAGYSTALLVAGGASVLGLCTFSYVSFSFFKTPPPLQSIKEVAQRAGENNIFPQAGEVKPI